MISTKQWDVQKNQSRIPSQRRSYVIPLGHFLTLAEIPKKSTPVTNLQTGIQNLHTLIHVAMHHINV